MNLATRTRTAAALRAAANALEADLREDQHEDTPFTQEVNMALKRFSEQHDYPSTEWAGVERLCYDLAKLTRTLAVEVPDGGEPWYDYESTERDADGKDWRYVLPDPLYPDKFVVVNCHSLLHDDVWTLSTTVFSTDEIDPNKLRWLSVPDHWARTMTWEIATADALATQGFGYETAISDMLKRLKLQEGLAEMVKVLLPGVYKAVTNVKGEEPELRDLSLGVSEAVLLPGKIGEHEGPRDQLPYSIITVHPNALKDVRYLEQVMKHELIHFLTSKECDRYAHDADFQDVAAEIKLPTEYRD